MNNFLTKITKQRVVVTIFWLVALVYLFLDFIGAANNYSPVPFWDMWGGYLDFFVKISDGDYWAWLGQHNEHRIVVSRMLFWIDIKALGGSGLFLIVMNYVFAFLAFVIFFFCTKEALKNDASPIAKNLISATILILLFSWVQRENFNWAFQSQFFLAQLLPLLAFYLLHKSHQSSENSQSLFFLACLVGVASAGTMANGVVALPLMVLLSVVLRMSSRKIWLLVILTTSVITAYFYKYDVPTLGKKAILENPLELAQYVICYLGNPVRHVSGLVAQIIGLVFIANSIFFAFKFYKQRKSSSLQLSLIAFIMYIGATAAITGGGRLGSGVEQAFSSRYSTPVLMAWSALLVIYAPIISEGLRKKFAPFAFLLMLVLTSLLPKQRHVFDKNEGVFESKIAALALEIGVRDEVQLKRLYPEVDHLISFAKVPIERNLSIFGNPLIKDVRQLIGSVETVKFATKCIGNLEEITAIDGEENYVKIEGWVLDSDSESVPKIIHVVGENNKIIGYALVGKKRTDIKKSVNNQAKFSGFKGYLLKSAVGKKVILNGINADCSLTLETKLTK
jgi:hypothetical protein